MVSRLCFVVCIRGLIVSLQVRNFFLGQVGADDGAALHLAVRKGGEHRGYGHEHREKQDNTDFRLFHVIHLVMMENGYSYMIYHT